MRDSSEGGGEHLHADRQAVVAGAERHAHRRVAGEVRRDRVGVAQVHRHRIGGLVAEAERHRRRRRGEQHVGALVGGGEVGSDAAADLERPAVVGVVVARRQRVGAEHDAPLDLGAEAVGACRHVHRVRVGRFDAMAEADAVVAGEVARRLGRGDQVVGGEAVAERGHLDVDDLGARLAQRVERLVEPRCDVGARALGQVGDASDAQSGDAHLELAGDVERALADRGRVHRVVAGDRLEHERGVGDVVGERADLVEARRERDEPVAADRAVGGLDADDAAQRGGLADRAAGVGAEADRGEAGRDRCG